MIRDRLFRKKWNKIENVRFIRIMPFYNIMEAKGIQAGGFPPLVYIKRREFPARWIFSSVGRADGC